MLSQDGTCVRQYDERKVDPDHQKRADDEDATHALGLGEAVPKAWSWHGGRCARHADRHSTLTCSQTCSGRSGDFDVGDIVFWASEAGRVVHHCAADSGSCAALGVGVVLTDDEEPGHSESSGVCRVDECVENVEPCQGEALERGLFPDVWREGGSQHEGEERVDVHGNLQWGEMEACEDCQEAIEAGDFVQQEGERDELCSRA